MPTNIGAETIGECLKRLRIELTRVRDTIARHENNGATYNVMGGVQVTEIAYDRALCRRREIEAEIGSLEARLAGSAARPGMAQVSVRMD